jgi:hypothetical protein
MKKSLFYKTIQCLFLVLGFAVSSFATTPTWTVNEVSFKNTMTITGIVNCNNTEFGSANDMVAAFVGTECRGVAHLLPSTSLGHANAYLMVMSNTNNETLSFKIFRSSDACIITVNDNAVFVSDTTIGTQDHPYLFSDKTVDGTAITSISFGVTGESSVIDSVNHSISVSLPKGTDITALTPVIISSIGSHAFISDSIISASTTIDITQAVNIRLIAQNGKTTLWSIVAATLTTTPEVNDNKVNITVRADKTLVLSHFPENAQYSIYSITGQLLMANRCITNTIISCNDVSRFYPCILVVKNENNTVLFSKMVVW